MKDSTWEKWPGTLATPAVKPSPSATNLGIRQKDGELDRLLNSVRNKLTRHCFKDALVRSARRGAPGVLLRLLCGFQKHWRHEKPPFSRGCPGPARVIAGRRGLRTQGEPWLFLGLGWGQQN
jgi:hypothetical protein